MANQRGIPSLPSTLIRPTTQPEPSNGDLAEDQAEPEGEDQAEPEGQGRRVALEPKPRARRRSSAARGETRGRKLSLPDSVFDRLQLTAIQRRKTISAVAAEILDRNLPKLRIEREG
jgi:hypothetical protein